MEIFSRILKQSERLKQSYKLSINMEIFSRILKQSELLK